MTKINCEANKEDYILVYEGFGGDIAIQSCEDGWKACDIILSPEKAKYFAEEILKLVKDIDNG